MTEHTGSQNAASPNGTLPVLLMSNVSTSTLWEQPAPSLEIEQSVGRPKLSLVLANDAQTRLANKIVTGYHYLHSPVDMRCSLLAYLVLLGGQSIGCLIFGRPEATKAGEWYGDVAGKAAGKCRLSRWEVLNLARIWFDPAVQEGGLWHDPNILPGFVTSIISVELTLILFLAWKKYADVFGNVYDQRRISSNRL